MQEAVANPPSVTAPLSFPSREMKFMQAAGTELRGFRLAKFTDIKKSSSLAFMWDGVKFFDSYVERFTRATAVASRTSCLPTGIAEHP